MLVLLSDIHLTDETTAINVKADAFSDILGPQILHNAKAKKATEIHIVLLGDIFDLVRTDRWLRYVDPNDRPWNGELDPITGMNKDTEKIAGQFQAVLDDILKTDSSQAFFKMFNDLHLAGKEVKVTYVIGNHDRIFNNFQSLKSRVIKELPGINLEFTNVLVAPEYGVLARHGHEWDEVCHGWEFSNKVLRKDRGGKFERFEAAAYKVMTLGEVITAELMSGLIYEVSKSSNDRDLLACLKELNNLRPFDAVFEWLDWMTRDRLQEHKKLLQDATLTALSNVLNSKLAQLWDKITPDLIVIGDLTDRLALVLRMLKDKKNGFESLRRVLAVQHILENLKKFLKGDDDRFMVGAEKDFDGVDARIQYVVYGHTHEARQDYLEGHPDGSVKMYINCGTYLPLIQATRNRKGFATAHRMTMAFFFRADEDENSRKDHGPTLTLWNGIRRKMYV